MSRPFRRPASGVLLVDSKARRYLVTLAEGGEFHTHAGPVPHDDLLGREEGSPCVRARAPATPSCGRPWPTSS